MIKELFTVIETMPEGIDPGLKGDCTCCCYCRIDDPDRCDTFEDEVREGE